MGMIRGLTTFGDGKNCSPSRAPITHATPLLPMCSFRRPSVFLHSNAATDIGCRGNLLLQYCIATIATVHCNISFRRAVSLIVSYFRHRIATSSILGEECRLSCTHNWNDNKPSYCWEIVTYLVTVSNRSLLLMPFGWIWCVLSERSLRGIAFGRWGSV